MKIGDLVRYVSDVCRVGIVVEMIQKKCWRTEELGPMIDWSKIDPESHAVVLFPHDGGTISIPAIELEVFDESR